MEQPKEQEVDFAMLLAEMRQLEEGQKHYSIEKMLEILQKLNRSD